MTAVLFVCLGNICRSPAAEAVFLHLAGQHPEINVTVESCGIGDWHTGEPADKRMRAAALQRGVTIGGKAQPFHHAFFDQFDYILAADQEVLKDLHRMTDALPQKAKIQLFTAFSSRYHNEEVPDPYYGGSAGFELVMDMLEDSCQGLLDRLNRVT